MHKKETQKRESTHYVDVSLESATLKKITMTLINPLLVLWTEIEPHTAITTNRKNVRRKYNYKNESKESNLEKQNFEEQV